MSAGHEGGGAGGGDCGGGGGEIAVTVGPTELQRAVAATVAVVVAV